MPNQALCGIALAALVAAAPAAAVDLTGTWEGSYTCKRFGVIEQETVTEKTKDATLRILQTGATLAAEIDGGLVYRGATIDAAADGARRGEAALVSCDSDALPLDGGVHEIVRFKVKVDAAKETGIIIVDSLHEHGQNGIMSCKLKFKRFTTVIAKFQGCP